MIDLEAERPILDIRIARVAQYHSILAATESNLYQLVGTDLKQTLMNYQNDIMLRECHCIELKDNRKKHIVVKSMLKSNLSNRVSAM